MIIIGFLGTANIVQAQTTENATTNGSFETKVQGLECISWTSGIEVGNCIVGIAYWIFFALPAFILVVAAKFFNALLALTLSSALYGSFIEEAWTVVRDVSNIFFILILLYVAVKTILDLGSDSKKIIARVIIMALLINFSMFFTKVVIDSSNILALIFYNKIGIKGPNAQSLPPDTPTTNATMTNVTEKNISGALASGFNPAGLITSSMFDKGTITVPKFDYRQDNIDYCLSRTETQDYSKCLNEREPDPNIIQETKPGPGPSTAFYLGIIFVSCAIFLFAAYAFFIAGLSFLGRLIELWILIIFSPFAFMSSSIPLLDQHVEGIGWTSWLKRLLSTAFMAPIFMFFLYVISKIVGAMRDVFDPSKISTMDTFGKILSILIPAAIILSLLMKAVEYAKKGGGQFGALAMKGGQLIGGLALGAATGGAAMVASNTIGRSARNIANNDELKEKAAGGDRGAQRRLALANSLAKNSFDFRQTGIGQFAAQKTGMDFNKGLGIVGLSTEKLKGGRAERDKEVVETHIANKKSYRLSGTAGEKQNKRADEYNKDKKTAEDNITKSWDSEYKENLGRAKEDGLLAEEDEERFKKDYEEKNPRPKFDEDAFKDAYVRGDREKLKKDFEIDKDEDDKKQQDTDRKFRKGAVGNAVEVNKDRDDAYALSLKNPYSKIENGEVVKRNLREEFGGSFRSGMQKMVYTPTGVATIATVGALTGGIGAVLAIPLGGIVHAIKDLVRIKEEEVIVAGMQKGESKEQRVYKAMEKVFNENNMAKGEGDKSKPAQTTPPPNTTPPTDKK